MLPLGNPKQNDREYEILTSFSHSSDRLMIVHLEKRIQVLEEKLEDHIGKIGTHQIQI